MRIVIMGPKSSGKTVIGQAFANSAGIDFCDLDSLIIDDYRKQHGGHPEIGDIYRQTGAAGFAELELAALERLNQRDWYVLSVGGSTPMQPAARRCLRQNSMLVLLTDEFATLWRRTRNRGRLPAYLENEADPERAFARRVERFLDVVTPYADIVIDKRGLSRTEVEMTLREAVTNELHLRMDSPSSLGELVRLVTFGESHGPAVGAVVDGVPPGIALEASEIQTQLERRRPGQSQVSTSRRETDQVEILSGLFEGRTTGAPIAMLIRNCNQKSGDYDHLRDLFRPGHADFSFFHKFGRRDHRGGGRSSGRETAARVAAGGVARRILLDRGVRIIAWASEIGGIKAETEDWATIEDNPVRAADPEAAKRMEARIIQAREDGDSVGGIVQIRVQGVPPGLGDPVFFKLDARLAMGLISLGAVKGVEIGSGFKAAEMTGCQHNDQMRDGDFLSNHAGGILGGISSGQEIVLRLAVKPTPSIAARQAAMDRWGRNLDLQIAGRHDPCIVPRLIPVAESMVALVLLDAMELQRRMGGPASP